MKRYMVIFMPALLALLFTVSAFGQELPAIPPSPETPPFGVEERDLSLQKARTFGSDEEAEEEIIRALQNGNWLVEIFSQYDLGPDPLFERSGIRNFIGRLDEAAVSTSSDGERSVRLKITWKIAAAHLPGFASPGDFPKVKAQIYERQFACRGILKGNRLAVEVDQTGFGNLLYLDFQLGGDGREYAAGLDRQSRYWVFTRIKKND